MANDSKPTGVGLALGVFGALAAIGGAVAMGSSKKPGLRGARPVRGISGPKKPCGCGR